jgi:hypothetical protein
MSKVRNGVSTRNRDQLSNAVRSLASSPNVDAIPRQLRSTLFDANGQPKLIDTNTIVSAPEKVRNALNRWSRVSKYTDYADSGDDDDDAVTTWNELIADTSTSHE